jgi:hypothetical protein
MKEYSNEDSDSATPPAASRGGVLRRMIGSDAQPMSLEGGAALDLYLAEISRNASKLQAQADLLQSALRERQDLLRELQSTQTGSADLTNKLDSR